MRDELEIGNQQCLLAKASTRVHLQQLNWVRESLEDNKQITVVHIICTITPAVQGQTFWLDNHHPGLNPGLQIHILVNHPLKQVHIAIMQLLEVLSEIQRITCLRVKIGKTISALILHLEPIYSSSLIATIKHGKGLNLLLRVNVRGLILALIITQTVVTSKWELEITETWGTTLSKVKIEKITLQEKRQEWELQITTRLCIHQIAK